MDSIERFVFSAGIGRRSPRILDRVEQKVVFASQWMNRIEIQEIADDLNRMDDERPVFTAAEATMWALRFACDHAATPAA